jgi:hypothetical protein
MSAKEIYREIAQRYIDSSAKELVAANSEIQEAIGFLVYHALESIACAVIVHFKSSIPLNHETKLNMFLRFSKRHFSESVNLKTFATVISRINNYGYREKFLYPEFQSDDTYKAPQEQITIIQARLLIQDVDRIINQIINLI